MKRTFTKLQLYRVPKTHNIYSVTVVPT